MNLDRWFIRSLETRDYDDIKEISKGIWDGDDYLPKVFFDWLDAPGLFIGVEDTENHKIVAVNKYSYLFDGTGWLEGLRVHSSYRNLGLSKFITKPLFEKALQDLQSCKILRIANCTHLSNEISIHLSLTNGFHIRQRYLVVEAKKKTGMSRLNVLPWKPTFNELKEQPYFQNTDNYICQCFLVQSITQRWFDELKDRVHFAILGDSPGWVDPAHEPHVIILNPSPKSVIDWLQYGMEVLGQETCITFLYPDPEMIKSLKDLEVQTWMNFEPDCLYLVYSP